MLGLQVHAPNPALYRALLGIKFRSSRALSHQAISPPNRLLNMGLGEYLLCLRVSSLREHTERGHGSKGSPKVGDRRVGREVRW